MSTLPTGEARWEEGIKDTEDTAVGQEQVCAWLQRWLK